MPVTYAILGDPVEQSRSPRIHNAAFQALGIDAVYEKRRVDADAAPRVLRELAVAGGGGNVTAPHKRVVVSALDVVSEAVRLTGACNTFWGSGAGVHGDNTDVEGFAAAAREHGVRLRGARVLLLGSGGAAAAVVAALLGEGAADVRVVNRTRSRADGLVAHFGRGDVLRTAAEPDAGDCDVVINATSMGMHAGDAFPLPVEAIPAKCAVLDLVYKPELTPWVRALRASGRQAWDGTEMLLRQAAAAFERWTGRDAPLEVMRNALLERPAT